MKLVILYFAAAVFAIKAHGFGGKGHGPKLPPEIQEAKDACKAEIKSQEPQEGAEESGNPSESWKNPDFMDKLTECIFNKLELVKDGQVDYDKILSKIDEKDLDEKAKSMAKTFIEKCRDRTELQKDIGCVSMTMLRGGHHGRKPGPPGGPQ